MMEICATLLMTFITLVNPTPAQEPRDSAPNAIEQAVGRSEPTNGDPYAHAYDAFNATADAIKEATVRRIVERIEDSDDIGIRRLLKWRDRARRELRILPTESESYHDPAVYAPGVKRSFARDGSTKSVELEDDFYIPGSEPAYVGRVVYDFGLNIGIDTGVELTADDEIWNLFLGYPPDTDILVAWLKMKLDHADELDAISQHFSKVYCDLDGSAYHGLTLYGAFASSSQFDMPDVDVIAYAQNVLGDHSFVAPIPQNRRVQNLYQEMQDGFLSSYRHNTLVTYIANMLINPEAPIHLVHESLRERILYLLHLEDLKIANIRNRLIEYGDRQTFVVEIDKSAAEDDSWRWYGRAVASRLNDVRWSIAHIVYDVLREQGLLRDRAAQEDITSDSSDDPQKAF